MRVDCLKPFTSDYYQMTEISRITKIYVAYKDKLSADTIIKLCIKQHKKMKYFHKSSEIGDIQ